MRRYAFIVLVLVCASRSGASYSGGDGSALEPYRIATAEDLADLSLDPDNWHRHFRLAADVDMRDVPSPLMRTIGNDEIAFSGVFDGNGRVIRNFTCANPDGDTAGLFGQVRSDQALICDVVLVDPNVRAEAAEYVGVAALVGRLRSGLVTGCRIEGATVRGYSSVGAVVGWNQGEISHCAATGTVSGRYSVGGLVGTTFWGRDIHHCRTDVTVTGFNRIGGLAGNCALASIAWCSSAGAVEGSDYIGGFLGSSEGGIITNCYSTAAATGATRIGGFVGQNSWSCDCSAGAYPSELTCCYATGRVEGQAQAGGFTGVDENCIVIASFWNSETSGQTHSASGAPLTAADFQRPEIFLNANWAFESESESLDFWVLLEGWEAPMPAWQLVEGDLDGDGFVGLKDFALLARSWQAKSDSCWRGGTDLTGDGCLDACDLARLCTRWLDGKTGPVGR